MIEERCEVCGSEMDGYGCMGTLTDVHTIALYDLTLHNIERYETAMKQALDTLEEVFEQYRDAGSLSVQIADSIGELRKVSEGNKSP